MNRKPAFPLLVLLLLTLAVCAKGEVAFGTLSFPENAESVDLGNIVVRDFDALEAFLDQLPDVTRVDMWETPMTADQCDRLAARYPAVRWGWSMVIRSRDHRHVIRTDDTSFSTLHNNRSAGHTSGDFAVLKYCWNLMALDIGHNKVDTLDFLYDLPNLRVLIAACNQITDITPVASLKKLEYAELFKNSISDITPLRGLNHLMDLNLCFNRIDDLSVLADMHSLKRLWLYSCRYVNREPPRETVRYLQEALPETLIDFTHYSTAGKWRYTAPNKPDPHYMAILEMFGADHLHPAHRYVPFEDSWPEEE